MPEFDPPLPPLPRLAVPSMPFTSLTLAPPPLPPNAYVTADPVIELLVPGPALACGCVLPTLLVPTPALPPPPPPASPLVPLPPAKPSTG